MKQHKQQKSGRSSKQAAESAYRGCKSRKEAAETAIRGSRSSKKAAESAIRGGTSSMRLPNKENIAKYIENARKMKLKAVWRRGGKVVA